MKEGGTFDQGYSEQRHPKLLGAAVAPKVPLEMITTNVKVPEATTLF